HLLVAAPGDRSSRARLTAIARRRPVVEVVGRGLPVGIDRARQVGARRGHIGGGTCGRGARGGDRRGGGAEGEVAREPSGVRAVREPVELARAPYHTSVAWVGGCSRVVAPAA